MTVSVTIHFIMEKRCDERLPFWLCQFV